MARGTGGPQPQVSGEEGKRMGRGDFKRTRMIQNGQGCYATTPTVLCLLCLVVCFLPTLASPSLVASLHRSTSFVPACLSFTPRPSCRSWVCQLERANPRGSTPIGVGRGNLELLDGVPFPLGMATRRVWVWTPKGYEASNESFPVVYCQDGQNKMDRNTSWLQADWQLGRAASILQDEGSIVPTIFVLIENAGALRFIEYADNMLGNAYVKWMSDTLKPYVDERFRTSKTPESTFAMGSSLGASISFLAAYQRPDVFGGACCISPAFQTNTIASVLFDLQGFASNKYDKMRIYIDNGGSTEDKEVPLFDPRDGLQRAGYWWLDTQLQPSIDAMLFALESRGLTRASGRLKYIKFPGRAEGERHVCLLRFKVLDTTRMHGKGECASH